MHWLYIEMFKKALSVTVTSVSLRLTDQVSKVLKNQQQTTSSHIDIYLFKVLDSLLH